MVWYNGKMHTSKMSQKHAKSGADKSCCNSGLCIDTVFRFRILMYCCVTQDIQAKKNSKKTRIQFFYIFTEMGQPRGQSGLALKGLKRCGTCRRLLASPFFNTEVVDFQIDIAYLREAIALQSSST